MKIIYSYKMINLYDDDITINVLENDTVITEFFNFDTNTNDYRKFDNEEKAYNYFYKRGYRE